MKIKKAIILAAGFGKRLNPLTLEIPKPLLMVNSANLLDKTINVLKKFGVSEIFINLHYLSEKIIFYLKNNNINTKISFSNEKNKILDTGGGILNIISRFEEEAFIVLNPDTIWSEEYLKEFKDMEKFFFSQKCNNVLLVVDKQKSFDKSLKGDFNLNNNLLNRNSQSKNFIYTGAQIINKKAFNNRKIDFFSINEVWDDIISKNTLFGFESKNEFLHVSTLDMYNKILKKFKY